MEGNAYFQGGGEHEVDDGYEKASIVTETEDTDLPKQVGEKTFC